MAKRALRSQVFSIRLTNKEMRDLRRNAAKKRLDVTTFVRRTLIEQEYSRTTDATNDVVQDDVAQESSLTRTAA